MQMFLAGAGNAAVIVMPQPCLDTGYPGVPGKQTGNKTRSQVPECFFKYFLKIFIFGCAGSLLLCGFFSIAASGGYSAVVV